LFESKGLKAIPAQSKYHYRKILSWINFTSEPKSSNHTLTASQGLYIKVISDVENNSQELMRRHVLQVRDKPPNIGLGQFKL